MAMDSRQSRAATLMNAARRNHFVSRIEKYEAKVRQAKMASKEPAVARSEVHAQKQQPRLTEKVLVPERVVAPSPVVQGKASDLQVSDPHPAYSQDSREPEIVEKNVPEMVVMPETTGKIQKQHSAGFVYSEDSETSEKVQKQHSAGFVYSEDSETSEKVQKQQSAGFAYSEDSRVTGKIQRQNTAGFVYSEDSPEQKTVTDKKEIVVGIMHRPPPSAMDDILQGFGDLNVDPLHGSQVLGREFSLDMPALESQGGVYLDLMQQKPPSPVVELEVDIHEVASSLKIRIKAADMHTSMQEHAFRCARECLDTFGKHQSKRIAFTLKKDFDKVYGPAWHCIVGTSFGSYVTHSLGGFVYFSLDKVSVLLFKTTVEPVEAL